MSDRNGGPSKYLDVDPGFAARGLRLERAAFKTANAGLDRLKGALYDLQAPQRLIDKLYDIHTWIELQERVFDGNTKRLE